VIVRQLKKSELHVLADMLYLAIHVPIGQEAHPRDIIYDKSLVKYFENWGKDKYDQALVAVVNEVIVGCIWGRQFPSSNKGFGYVDDDTPELSMAVTEIYRNKGIGSELLQEICQMYSRIGVGFVSLSVDKTNRAKGLYKRIGFETVKETETSLTMKKPVL
jgi:ribosomal protein S18 acetylase RimI-like enzyme